MMTMRPPVIMHVNYCEQGQTLAEMCLKAVDWGFDGIEFRRRRAGVEESEETYLDQIAEAVSRSGLRQVLFGLPGVNLMSADAGIRAKEIESAIRFYTLALQRVKLTVCNTFAGSLPNPDKSVPGSDYSRHGSFVATEDQWCWAIDGFQELGRFAAEKGFRLAFETHMIYLHDRPLVSKRLVDRIGSPAVGVNLDYGNAVYFPENPSLETTIRGLGSSLFYIHLKNSIGLPGGHRVPTALSEGEINHRVYLRLLKDCAPAVPICIEAPRAGDRETFARQDLAYLKSLLEELKW
jgi:sugar phosphate isomerase/epimerase